MRYLHTMAATAVVRIGPHVPPCRASHPYCRVDAADSARVLKVRGAPSVLDVSPGSGRRGRQRRPVGAQAGNLSQYAAPIAKAHPGTCAAGVSKGEGHARDPWGGKWRGVIGCLPSSPASMGHQDMDYGRGTCGDPMSQPASLKAATMPAMPSDIASSHTVMRCSTIGANKQASKQASRHTRTSS